MNIRPYPPVILPTRDNPMGLAPEDRADFEAEVAGLVKRIAHAEADPTGRNPHEPGAKVDAGKDEYDMVLFSFPNALAKVDRVGKFGARKYTKGGFLEVPNGQRRYFNADIRHAISQLQGEQVDPESGELHLAHKAWNALAELELFLRGKGG